MGKILLGAFLMLVVLAIVVWIDYVQQIKAEYRLTACGAIAYLRKRGFKIDVPPMQDCPIPNTENGTELAEMGGTETELVPAKTVSAVYQNPLSLTPKFQLN
jgi:hypothetical protein